jgi:UDPglucose 6-dehydrogenase
VVAFDPEGIEQAKPMLQGVTYAEDAYACATGADVLVLVTEWRQFRALDLPRLKELMNAPVLVDLRNVYSPAEAEKHGFQYTGIGTTKIDA